MDILKLFIMAALIATGTFLAADAVLILPSGKAREALIYRFGKPKITQRLEELLLMPLAKGIDRLYVMSEFKQRRMAADFERLGRKETPQQFVSKTAARSVLFALLGLLFIPAGFPILTLLILALAVMGYFQAMQSVRKQVEKANRELEAELPRLVETLNWAIKDNRDLVTFFEKYRKVAGTVMSRELDRLLFEMKTGNHTIALRNFDARLQIPQLSALVANLCGVHQGVDQRTSLLVLEQDIRTRQREQFRREAQKRPGRVKIASLILTMLMILLFMVPIAMLIVSHFNTNGI